MKLKIILVLILAFFTCAFAASPIVQAEGEEITTTISEDITTALTTTTQSAIQAEVDAQLEKAQALIMSGVVSIGGAGTVGGVVSLFLTKRRKQINDQIAVAQKAYDSGKEVVEGKFAAFQKTTVEYQAKAEAFQKDMAAKYEAAMKAANEQTAKANELAAKAATVIEKYQAREDALVAYAEKQKALAEAALKAEADRLAAAASTAINGTSV